MDMKTLRKLAWILPVSLAAGLTLALFDGGTWWIGMLAYGLLFSLGLLALSALWGTAEKPKGVMLMLLLALILRLGMGLFFSWALPAYGNDTPVQNAGYIFRDASAYDQQSWDLAVSTDPLWKAFERSYGIDDQYGGLTFFLGLVYRLLSAELHRPWLIILFAAIAGAIGTGLAWKGARQAWGEPVALGLGWIMALYPESLVAGGSQMREPFLILFTSAFFLGLVSRRAGAGWKAWAWMGGGLLGGLLFSPGMALTILVVLVVWDWLQGGDRRIRWGWVIAGAALVLAGLIFLGSLMGGALQAPAGPLANLVTWLKYSAAYSAYETELGSGWIQTIFDTLPKPLHLPFLTAYGVIQPLLPAAIIDSGVWPMRLMGIVRGLGWSALLPFFFYSLRPILKTTSKHERLSWLWLWIFTWFWVLLCSFRGGGDQWDNPRYRLIFLLFQAGLAAFSFIWARRTHDRWFGRTFLVEVVLLGGILAWYISRYDAAPGALPLAGTLGLTLGACVLILAGGWLYDRLRPPKAIDPGNG
jgi:hypothetical protein